jgi:hypothetical protein
VSPRRSLLPIALLLIYQIIVSGMPDLSNLSKHG